MDIIIQNLNLSIYANACDSMTELSSVTKASDLEHNESDVYTKESAPDGVYLYADNGGLWTSKAFDVCKPIITVKGVVIIKGDQRLVVALKGSDNIMLLGQDKTLLGKIYETYQRALKDNEGFDNTEKLLGLESSAAKFCKTLGKEWYIPTMSEMQLMCAYKDELDECLSLAGEKMPNEWHWTSTRYSERSHFVFCWVDGSRNDVNLGSDNRVRPVSALL